MSRNPLAGRVTMNRQWAAFFGRGLVRTAEDFGYQGEPPTHPELLDWLAVEFMRAGLVDEADAPADRDERDLSAVVAGDARAAGEGPARTGCSPAARAFRLEAELIRDAALHASGLLSEQIGGPSVFPPQPPGVTTEGTYGGLAVEDQPGRGPLSPRPVHLHQADRPVRDVATFDAPSGEVCVARREVSNTPLQALTLLNDPVFVEAAQALGRTIAAAEHRRRRVRTVSSSAACLRRPADARRARMLLVAFFQSPARPLGARRARRGGHRRPRRRQGAASNRPPGRLVARAILNLDETITKD